MEFDLDRDKFRRNLLKYTRQAFEAIPPLEKPSILDLGCGSGVQTVELARISGGSIVAIDLDQAALDKLRTKIVEDNLGDQIEIIQESIKDLSFLHRTFDIIWAEGSIYAVGFERGLCDWRNYLVSGGCLSIHDDASNKLQKLQMISKHGYQLILNFDIPHEAWWEEYYQPLESYIDRMMDKGTSHSNILNEIRQFKKNRTSSTFIIVRKL